MKQIEVRRENKIKRNAGEQILQAIIYLIIILLCLAILLPCLKEIEKDIEERDYRDMTRKIAPLKKAEDAILVDSSDMTLKEVVNTISRYCHR